MRGYDGRLGRFGAGELATLLVLGVAAGAITVWVLAASSREKVSLGRLGEVRPRHWLAKAAQALKDGRERLVNAVDEHAADTQSS